MFTISAWLRGLMLEHTGIDDISFIPNSVDFSRFNSPERGKQIRPTVGFLHDLRSQKGTNSILLALQRVQTEIPDLRVISFGPHLPKESLPNGSEFFHFADDSDLPSIYSKCDVWLFASTLEGFGLPIVEAMACRTPVIATPAGAAPELLKSGGGRLIPHGDPMAMADAIVDILRLDNNDWRLLSRKAYDSVQGFTWDDATDMFEQQLQLALVAHDLPARKSEKP
jgi:glycosyltransferase involved in cell wall biosynthesis